MLAKLLDISFKITLSTTHSILPVIHINYLRKFNPLVSALVSITSAHVLVEREERHIVEKIIRHRRLGSRALYTIKWQGF